MTAAAAAAPAAAQDGSWRGRAGTCRSRSRNKLESYRLPVACPPPLPTLGDGECVFHGLASEINAQMTPRRRRLILSPAGNQRQTTHLLHQTCHSYLLRRPPLRLDIQRRLDCTRFRFRAIPAVALLRQLRCCMVPQPSLVLV